MADRQIDMPGEQWLPVPGYEGRYEVSNFGRIKSLSTYRPNSGGILSHWVQNRGYQYVTLRNCDGKKAHAVHQLVLEAFVGPRPQGKQVAHRDGDPTNNRVENLRWATAKENIADRTAHGRSSAGEANGSAKLDRHVVKTIKKMRGQGFSAYETARLACVHPSTIQAIWSGRLWRHA